MRLGQAVERFIGSSVKNVQRAVSASGVVEIALRIRSHPSVVPDEIGADRATKSRDLVVRSILSEEFEILPQQLIQLDASTLQDRLDLRDRGPIKGERPISADQSVTRYPVAQLAQHHRSREPTVLDGLGPLTDRQ